MHTGILLAAAAAAVFLGTGAVALSSLWTRAGKAPAWLFFCIFVGILLHGLSLSRLLITSEGFVFGFGSAVSVAMLLATALLTFGAFFHRIGPVLGVSLVITGAASLLPVFLPGGIVAADAWSTLFRVHLSVGLLTYGMLAVTMIQAVLMELQDQRFRNSSDPIPGHGILSTLPPILVMEEVFFYLLTASYVFMTALLVTGVFATEEYYGKLFCFDHKTFLTWGSWLVFSVLMFGHFKLGWRGHKALSWFWVLCALYAFAYLGYALVSELFNH